MKRFLLLAATVVAVLGSTSAQNVIPCYTDELLAKKIAENPALAEEYRLKREAMLNSIESTPRGGGPRIIPVVFHIVHQGGEENISKAQIEDQLRVLNEDYRRLNADTTRTREIFKPIAADCNIEFKLAQKDPQGNCTEGIVRVYSSISSNAGDGVKALSYWPSNKYLNVWVVSSIASDGSGGTILGYAQFPGFGAAETDGVVVRHDVVGTIGTVNPILDNNGRTLTHEVGHWLGLSHTFQGGCTGGFLSESVDDTPPTLEANYGCDTTTNSCHNDNPDLPDMIENYMDYSNGECQNMFTLGQLDIMNTILDGTRSNIISQNNLIATGTDGSSATPCKPIAGFYADNWLSCTGDQVRFYDDSYNGDIDSYSWTFDGGSPATSTGASPNVSFSQTGCHQASLTVTNSLGSDTKTVNEFIYIMPDPASEANWFFEEGFEGNNPNSEDWFAYNNDGIGSSWQQANVGYTGSKSIKMNNFNGGNDEGAKDNLYLPPIDMTKIGSPKLTFKVAYAQKPGGTFSSPSEDGLKVYVSSNCGGSWQQRYFKKGENLSTATSTGSAFTPNSQSQWREETISMSSFASKDHLIIRFESLSDAGNNIYIDDINISAGTGLEELENGTMMTLMPNPADGYSSLVFNLADKEKVSIDILDITGRTVATVINKDLPAGNLLIEIDTQGIASGVYYVRLVAGNGQYVEKLVLR